MNSTAVLEWRAGAMLHLPAMDPLTSINRVRFGPFEADLRTGEVRKNGQTIRLSVQPFQVLALLLEHPGELVTRDDFRQKLWPADTFVDFDVGLNTAIRKLREALEDSAEHPQFIETLPRRGYRFIGKMAEVPALAVREVGTAQSPPAEEGQALFPRVRRIVLTGLAAAMVFALAVLGFVHVRRWGASKVSPDDIRAIAVLPLENLTGDSSQEYFADGMTDALITNLAQIRGLRVISRTSALHYKGAKKTIPEIAKELSVDAVVEGTVARSGSRVRIDAQLIHGATDRHLWAKSYERELTDVLALQGDLARAISAEVAVKLSPREENALVKARPVNPEAYEAYLKGKYFYEKRSVEALSKSIDYLQQAIQKDPQFAPAYAALAENYTTMGGGFPAGIPSAEAATRALSAASKAVELDANSAEAHAALGFARWMFATEVAHSEAEFQRAIELNPGYANAHFWYSHFLNGQHKVNEALAEIRIALALDPVSPNINGRLTDLLLAARQYDKAVEQGHRMIELDPHQFNSRLRMAWIYIVTGQPARALPELDAAEAISPGTASVCTLAGYAYGHLGRRADAERELERCKRLPSARRKPSGIGMIYLALGQKNEAISWFEKAYAEHDAWLRNRRDWPEFNDLRGDPRFADLDRRLERDRSAQH